MLVQQGKWCFSLNWYYLFGTKVCQRNLQTISHKLMIREIHTVWSEIDITFRLISNKTTNKACKVWWSVSM